MNDKYKPQCPFNDMLKQVTMVQVHPKFREMTFDEPEWFEQEREVCARCGGDVFWFINEDGKSTHCSDCGIIPETIKVKCSTFQCRPRFNSD